MKIQYFFGMVLLITILSCSAQKEEGTNDPSLARVIVKKELLVGVDPSVPPLSFYSSTGEITGYEVDIARAVADRLGVNLTVVPITSGNRIKKLENREINYIASGFINNEAAAERFLLSTPYLRDALVVVVLQSMDGSVQFSQFGDLRNRRIGMLYDEAMVEVVLKSPLYHQNGRRPYYYDQQANMLNALEYGQLDAVVMNLLTYYGKTTIEKKLYRAIGEPLIISTYSYAFRKEDKEMLKTMNAFLEDMARDGTLRILSEKWFGVDVSMVGKY